MSALPESSESDALGAPTQDDAAVVSPAQTSKAMLWLQVVLIIGLTQPFYSLAGHLLQHTVVPFLSYSFYGECTFYTLEDCVNIAIVLLLMRWTRESWSEFGFAKRNMPLDLVLGALAFAASNAFALMGGDFAEKFLRDVLGSAYAKIPHHDFHLQFPPQGISGVAALAIFCVAIAMAEELVSRSFLITRFERITKSRAFSVLLSATVFAIFHSYYGVVHVFAVFWYGIVYGLVFVWTRRLWPLVIAHALTDFAIFLDRM